jgi:hypothetical protein
MGLEAVEDLGTAALAARVSSRYRSMLAAETELLVLATAWADHLSGDH